MKLKNRFCHYFVVAGIGVMMSACGGGGGNDKDPADSPDSSAPIVLTQAKLTPANAMRFVLFFVNDRYGSVNRAVYVDELYDYNDFEEENAPTRGLFKSPKYRALQSGYYAQPKAAITVECDDGGRISYESGGVNDEAIRYSLIFDECAGYGVTTTGTHRVISPTDEDKKYEDHAYDLHTIGVSDYGLDIDNHVVLEGRVSHDTWPFWWGDFSQIDALDKQTRLNIRMTDLSVRDIATEEGYYDRYEGRIYYGQLGYVDIETVESLFWYDETEYGQASEGILLATGQQSSVRVEPTADALTVRIDTDGDGSFDFEKTMAWEVAITEPDLSELP